MLKIYVVKDILLISDILIFCMGKYRFVYIKNGIVDECECGMIDVRWKIFYFMY